MTKQRKITKRKIRKKKNITIQRKTALTIALPILLLLFLCFIYHKISVNLSTDPTTTGAIQVIDVSKWEGKIDWEKVEKTGIQHAVLKIGSGDYKGQGFHEDDLFEINYKNALKNKIHCGVYFFSYAVTKEEAEKEALYCLSLLEKYNISPDDLYFPVAFDIEYDKALRTGKRNCTDMAIAFCETIKNAGYEPMIYSSASYLENQLIYHEIKEYKIWVANYEADGPDFGNPYVMWQYSDSGNVDGVNDLCDMNYWYPNYTEAQKIVTDQDHITLSDGESITIDVTILPYHVTNKRLSFTSSNENVVKIADSQSGKIEAFQRGTAWITIKTPSGAKKRVKITVK